MCEVPGAGEQAARIVEAIEGGAGESGAAVLAEVARELRSAEVGDWKHAERIIEERGASTSAEIADLLDDAASAVRDRAIND